MGQRGDKRLTGLLTDEPGLVVHNPRRQLARLLVLYALLPLICAGAGAFIAYALAAQATDRRVEALEADLAQRRAARAQVDAATRQDVCVIADRVQPRDAQVQKLRTRYGCTGGRTPPPPQPPSGDPASERGRTPSSGQGADGARMKPPTPIPAPTPARTARPSSTPPAPPPPAPSEPDEKLLDLEVCIPLLDLCVL